MVWEFSHDFNSTRRIRRYVRWMGIWCMGKQLGSWETLGLDARADANLDYKQ